MKLKIEYLDNYDREWGELSKAHSTDAGFDLRSTIESIIYPDGILFVPLGFKTSFEEGYETGKPYLLSVYDIVLKIIGNAGL